VNSTPDTQQMTLAQGRAYLRAHYLPLTEIIDGLEERGLALARFRQLHRQGRTTCLSLKFTGMPDPHEFRLADQSQGGPSLNIQRFSKASR